MAFRGTAGDAQPEEHEPIESSTDLLRCYREGDREALSRLMERYAPRMARWARGRLPGWARSVVDTDDLVQDVLLRTLGTVGSFEPRGDGALQGYLRQAVLHRIQDEVRKVRRSPRRTELTESAPDAGPSPHAQAEASELYEAYEAALARLRDEDREAIVARVELRLPYREVAGILGKATAEAAQMAVSRALVRLAREMGRKP
jgi:RNA polymerase sigma factor (sigma-70 family)